MCTDLQVSPNIDSEDLNVLFAGAWPDYTPIDFRPILFPGTISIRGIVEEIGVGNRGGLRLQSDDSVMARAFKELTANS